MDTMNNINLANTENLIYFTKQLSWENLPSDVQHAAKRHFIDTLGVMIAGMQEDVSRKLADIYQNLDTNGAITLPGAKMSLNMLDAAMMGGTAAHGIELDDGYRQGSLHPGVTVIPSLLPVAIERCVSGIALLEALVVGYECVTSLAQAAHPRLRQRGFHPTSVLGVFASALATGRLLGLSSNQLQSAMGIAASSASGLFAFLRGGTDVKRIHAGQAARSGLAAALFAETGIGGPANVLEGKDGFLQAYLQFENADKFNLSLPPEHDYRITDCYIKPYACCRHLQPAVDAVLNIMHTKNITPDSISRIEVETYSIAAAHAFTLWEGFADAQLSFPYVLAVAALYGDVALKRFDQKTRTNAKVNQLANKVSIVSNDEMDSLYPNARPARVTILTTSGKTLTNFAEEALGCKAYPISDIKLAQKFNSLTEPLLGKRKTEILLEQLWNIDLTGNVSDIFKRIE
ncbi:MAG: MmgE/PrpD family protein [Methylocystaceae bacterium]|nr:MmgE/PrpD family protein [Methylocystaceae bacterium]